jgi:glycosyltransferase involved in cell wall biosynthesis
MVRRPRIAVDLRAALGAATGIGVYTRELVTALAGRGRVELLAVAHRPPADGRWLEEAGVPFEAQSAPSGVLWQQLALPRRLRRGDLDLLWSPLQTLPLALPLPGVVTVHDLTALLMPEVHRLKVRLSQAPLLGRSLDLAAAVVAVSEATAADVRRWFPDAAPRLRVIHPGVERCFRPPSEAERMAIREELGCPGGYILYAGTLEPRKNVDRLLDAWEALAQDGEAPPLVLAGPYGWKSRRLLARLERLGGQGVRVLGELERAQLVRVMQGALVFAYPSLYEGFGLPPLEAMACGVPVVVSNVSSLPEVVGDTGLQVSPYDPGELAGALRHLLEDRQAADLLGARGRQRAAAFTWERSAARLEEVLLAASSQTPTHSAR